MMKGCLRLVINKWSRCNKMPYIFLSIFVLFDKLSFCHAVTKKSVVGTFDLLSFGFGVSLKSEKYRSWILANPLFVCLTCIRPGAYFYILGESGVFKSYETYE